MKKEILILFGLLLSLTIKAQFTCGDTLIDTRDGKKYPTVAIGSQCWMAKNLDVGVMVTVATAVNVQTDNSIIEKFCYDNDTCNCDTFGGLYQFDEMMGYMTQEGAQGICPTGWHIPAKTEYEALFSNFNSGTVAADLQTGGSSGFDALPAGYCYHNYTNWVFGSKGGYGVLRTSSPSTMGIDYALVYYYYPTVGSMFSSQSYKKDRGYSVRCLWNGFPTGNNMEREIKDDEILMASYPNPASNEVIIGLNVPAGVDRGSLLLYNQNGDFIKEVPVCQGESEIRLDVSLLSSGMYFYQLVYDSKRTLVKKLEVIH